MNKYNEILEFLQNLSDEQINCLLETKTSEEDINVEDFLKQLGVNPGLLGFKYLKYAIEINLKGQDTIGLITKYLYPEIAKIYETTPSKVERAIRHAIESSWKKINPDIKREVFFNEVEKPTNSRYIAYTCNYIKNLKASPDKHPLQKVLSIK